VEFKGVMKRDIAGKKAERYRRRECKGESWVREGDRWRMDGRRTHTKKGKGRRER